MKRACTSSSPPWALLLAVLAGEARPIGAQVAAGAGRRCSRSILAIGHVGQHAAGDRRRQGGGHASSSRRCAPDVRIGVETFGDDVTVLARRRPTAPLLDQT